MINKIITDMILYFESDARRINHALKVYGFARAICSSEKITAGETEIIELAAILHDIGIKESERKYGSYDHNYQEIEGPPVAGSIIEKRGIDRKIIDRVCYIIGNHHSFDKIDGIDFQILVEADLIVNIFEQQSSRESMDKIKAKYFKTAAGKQILDSIFPPAPL